MLGTVEAGDQRFVHLRNPWGRGDWRGPWANASTQWDDFPEVLAEVSGDPTVNWSRDGADGTFLMAFEDFCARFDVLHVCRLFPDDEWKQYKVVSSWAGKTAAGPDGAYEAAAKAKATPEPAPAPAAAQAPGARRSSQRAAAPEKTEEPALADALKAHHGRFLKKDGDPYWFNNPQHTAEPKFSRTTPSPRNIHAVAAAPPRPVSSPPRVLAGTASRSRNP